MNQADKTKEKLASALKKLCKDKTLDKISVGELVKVSDMHRSTFYYHFKDIDDLVAWIFLNDIVQNFVEPAPKV